MNPKHDAYCKHGRNLTCAKRFGVTLEYLLAIMLQTARPKDWQRAALVADSATFDENRLVEILKRHQLEAAWNRIRSPN